MVVLADHQAVGPPPISHGALTSATNTNTNTNTNTKNNTSFSLRMLSLNTNGFSRSKTSHLLYEYALAHDVAFFQETHFANPTTRDKVHHKWLQMTNHSGHWFNCDPRFPTNPN